MNKSLVVIAIALALTACSSTKLAPVDAPQVTAIGNQKLSSNFKRRGIKLEFDCGTISSFTSGCNKAEPTAIEVTAYAPSYGNSESNRETAFHVAEMNAKAKLRRFIQEDIQTSSVTNTITKNIEKANDKIKQRINDGQQVTMSEDEAKEFNKDSNTAERENANSVTRTVTENVRMNAAGILKGVKTVDETIVDRQTVQVTIRWDRDSEAASQFFANKFRQQQSR
jgi:predicted nucleic acid-binding protein